MTVFFVGSFTNGSTHAGGSNPRFLLRPQGAYGDNPRNGNEVVEYSFWAEWNVAKEAFLLRNGSD